MAQRLIVELKQDDKDIDSILTMLKSTGAQEVPGFNPISMGSTICITIIAPDQATEERISKLPGIVGVYGDSQIDYYKP